MSNKVSIEPNMNGSVDHSISGIKIAVTMPRQCYDRESKLQWLDKSLQETDCDLFLTPQEYFGGHYIMKSDLHMDQQWMLENVGVLAKKHKKCLGIGACIKSATSGAMEDYQYYNSSGELLGMHSKFALPAYDDVRASGHGNLWPETNYQRRITPIEIPELGLRVGSIFCWEVFNQTIWPAYSLAGVNLVVHPIKFAPRGWLKNKKLEDGKMHIVGFGNAPKSAIWINRLLMASRHQVMCPIAVSCNSWDLGPKFMALVGMVDELKGTSQLFDVPAVGSKELIKVYQVLPKYYEGLDHHHSAGAFKAHVGSVGGFSEMSQWTMHGKIRRLEAQLLGGTTKMDCILKASALRRQKSSTTKRALGTGVQKVTKVTRKKKDRVN